MVKTYLVTFKPLEAYSFGSDRHFKFEGRKFHSDNDFSPYFIKTNAFPEQSTVFGALRYHILNQYQLIKANFDYNQEEREAMAALVGPESFSLEKKDQDFGKLHSISPIFLLKNGQDILVPCPFNHIISESNKNKSFSPIRLKTERIKTSFGTIHLPLEEDFDAKKGHAKGYYNISSGETEDESEIFKEDIFTGNKVTSHEDANNKDGLFKRQVYLLMKPFSFATYVQYDGQLSSGLVKMGQKGSLFQLEVSEAVDNLEQEIKEHFSGLTPRGLQFNYALSDIIVEDKIDSNDFSIIDEKSVKLISTNWSEKGNVNAINRSRDNHLLYSRGGVFYGDALSLTASKAGYNHVISIKGEK